MGDGDLSTSNRDPQLRRELGDGPVHGGATPTRVVATGFYQKGGLGAVTSLVLDLAMEVPQAAGKELKQKQIKILTRKLK